LDDGGLSAKLAALPTGQGAIFVVPHTGNWDLAGVAGQQMGLPIFFLVGHQKNPLVDAWLNRMRSIQGSETIARDSGALKKVIRNLRDGKVLAFMTDLRSRTPAMRVRFLGHEANVVAGMGLFARQAGVPVTPCPASAATAGRSIGGVVCDRHPPRPRPAQGAGLAAYDPGGHRSLRRRHPRRSPSSTSGTTNAGCWIRCRRRRKRKSQIPIGKFQTNPNSGNFQPLENAPPKVPMVGILVLALEDLALGNWLFQPRRCSASRGAWPPSTWPNPAPRPA
jgi:hypothetical protein